MKENLFDLPIPQSGIEDNFVTGLQAWVDEATALEGERGQRVIAMRRIIEAKSSRSTSLLLNGLGLSSLPGQIGDLTDLTSLILSRNEIAELPPEIERLAALETLHLVGNRLSALSAELC